MFDYLTVLAFALLPAGGNIIGGLLAESLKTPKWLVGAALHAAAGVAIALVSIDLMPRIVDATPIWAVVGAFLIGAAASVALMHLIRRLQDRSGNEAAGAWMVQMAVLVDLTSDGLMTGAGAGVSTGLGLLLALSQLLANIPGGFATAANFRHRGLERRRRLLIAALVPLPVFISASLGFWLLKGASPELQHAVLAVMVGVLLLTTVEDTVPAGDAPEPRRWISTAAFAGGFVVLALLSAGLR